MDNYDPDAKLPPYVIKTTASEMVTRYLIPEIERFMNMATDALAHDCEISNSEAEAILWDRIQSMARGLKIGQWTINHAAIYFNLHALFEERLNTRPYQINDALSKFWLIDKVDKPEKNEDEDEDGGEAVGS